MTAKNAGAGVGPPGPPNEKGARPGANLHGITETRRLSISAESVKSEAISQQLSHAEWLRRQGKHVAWASHMIALQIDLRRFELREGAL
jgi:hypothetical protein